MPLAPGQSLGHYRIERLIGQGGMGAVFLALDTKLHRRVALKVLPEAMAADPDRLARFEREARAVAALNHPHVVTLFSVEEDSGTHFLTMELVEGNSLNHGIPPDGLPLTKVFDIGIALADALAAAHDKGVIHRDMKPANVIVTRDGRVKVLDFGLAKLALGSPAGGPPVSDAISSAPTETAPLHHTLTSAGSVVGTVPYMSPEQVSGEAVDARTDIFSLGVLLYEMATGRRPFAGKNNAQTMSSILRDPPRPVTEVRPDAPRHLGRIIEHCLQKEPRDRFQTARDVFNELRALRKELESSASAVVSPPSAPAGAGRQGPPGSVHSSAPSSAPGPAAASTPSGTTAGTIGARLWLWAAGGAAVVLAVVAALWLDGRRGTGPVPSDAHATGSPAETPSGGEAAVTEMKSLAVLPFANMTGDPEQDYFSDGLTEELLNALVKIPDLKVAGRTSSFAFKGKSDDLRTIGKKLGVANILEGSVRKSENRVRIAAQLVKAEDGFHLWSEVYERELSDIFAIQGDVASRVARALSLELLPEQKHRLTHAATSVPAAHEAYLKGRFHWAKRTIPDLQKSIEYLEEAVALDDHYAEAWLGLAESWVVLVDYDPSQSIAQASARAREASRRALELDPTLVEARAALAMTATYEWDWVTAETELLQVIDVRPGYATARHWYAWLLVETNREELALKQIRRARELDPLSIIINSNVGQMLFYAGRYDEAIVELKRCLEMEPRFPVARRHLAMAYSLTGRGEEALEILAEMLDDHPTGGAVADLARAHAQMGHIKEAEALLERLRAMDGLPTVEIASVLAVLGRTNEALSALEQACKERNLQLRAIRVFGMFFRNLESAPRFREILRCVNLAQATRQDISM